MRTVGIVSPGAMGSAIATTLRRGGSRVVGTTAGRSARTAAFAKDAGVELLPDLAALVGDSTVILSVVPPELAETVAAEIAELARTAGTRPLVVDLNAIAPETSRRLAALVAEAGCDYVDGSISGPPPSQPDMTRIYLSGPRASEIAALPLTGVARIVVGPEVGMASAVKMSTASVYKGTSGLLTQALLAADANGVLEHVLDDLRQGSPELVANVARRVAMAATKSDRYVGEMREIAAAQAAAGLTRTLFDAMADVFATLSKSKLARVAPEEVPRAVTLDEVLGDLRERATDDRV